MNSEFSIELWQFMAAILATVGVTGGLSILGIGTLATRILQSPGLLRMLEALADNVRPDAALKLVEIGKSAVPIGNLVQEVFDRVPADSKPTPE